MNHHFLRRAILALLAISATAACGAAHAAGAITIGITSAARRYNRPNDCGVCNPTPRSPMPQR